MEAVKQFLADGAEQKLEEARKYDIDDSPHDPENEPFKSKYKAREIWSELAAIVEKHRDDDPGNQFWVFLLSALQLQLGANYIECEEASSGDDILKACEKALEPFKLDKYACSLYLNVLTQLGILWCTRRQFQTAQEYLQKAEKLYTDFKHEVGGAPHQINEILSFKFSDDSDIQKRNEAFEDAYTHVLYYLAQVYEKLEERKKAAEYCHVTLRRQLDTNKYNPLDWALNAATLSQYYITQGDFNMARHCMASSSVVMREVPDPNLPEPGEAAGQAELDEREKVPRAKADINRCWAKYGLALLEYSWEKLVESLENDQDHNSDKNSSSATNENSESEVPSPDEDNDEAKSDLFFKLEITSFEEQITCKNVLDFEQAKGVFLGVQKWLTSSKQFYGLDGHCSDYVEIIQDHSRVYKLLAYFEPDLERQCKMHKRRADLLEATLRELNPQFYLLVCRQLQFELAEIYSGMLDLKLAIMEEAGQPTGHAVRKINQLTQQAIEQYEAYIKTLYTSKDNKKELPSKFCNDDERPALVAHFCTGRLYSKFIEAEIPKRILHMNQSLKYYQFIVDYVKRNPESENIVKSEYEVCSELVLLLPAKMERVRAGVQMWNTLLE